MRGRGGRVTTCNRHDWQLTYSNYRCTMCPATADACVTCNRPLDTHGRTCDNCVARARNDLREIRDLYALLPDVIAATAGLHAIRYDQRGTGKKTRNTDTTIIGGAAFVLAGPGNSTDRGLQLGKYETTEAIAHLAAAEQGDPPSVLGVLTGWEDAWRTEAAQPAATYTTVAAALDYLIENTTWAAQHFGRWAEYTFDTRALLARLRNVTGTSNAPQRNAAPCPECGGTIVQHWTAKGLDDTLMCNRCDASYPNETRFLLAVKAAHQSLAQSRPDELITLDDARRILPDIKRNTINQAIKRDRARHPDQQRIPQRGTDSAGKALYRLGDLAALRALVA